MRNVYRILVGEAEWEPPGRLGLDGESIIYDES
jgi:hypothetical protein